MSAPTKSLVDQLRETVELLEAIAQDRTVLEGVPDEDRARLLQAVAMVYHPDRVERRRMANAVARERRASRIEKDQRKRAGTGIQTLRRKPVFHTPNVFPPDKLHEESHESQHCYVCKQHYTLIHHFYDQLCPDCAEFNFFKRTELADLRGRVALLTAAA